MKFIESINKKVNRFGKVLVYLFCQDILLNLRLEIDWLNSHVDTGCTINQSKHRFGATKCNWAWRLWQLGKTPHPLCGNVPVISPKYYNSQDTNFSLKNKINLFNGHEIRGARFLEMATVLVFRYSRMCFFGYWDNDLSLDKAW